MLQSTHARALVGLVLLAMSLSAHGQNWQDLWSQFFSGGQQGQQPRPQQGPKAAQPNAAYTERVLRNDLGPYLVSHPVARPALLRAVQQPGGVQAVSQATAFALKGIAEGRSNAQAIASWPGYGRLPQNARALSRTIAEAILGSAFADDLAQAAGFNAESVSQSIAKAFQGIAVSSSQAQTVALLNGVAIADARAEAIWGPALANANAQCVSAAGGCQAIAKAVAVAVGGPALAQAKCQAQGANAVAACSATARSNGGSASASSTAVARGRKLLTGTA